MTICRWLPIESTQDQLRKQEKSCNSCPLRRYRPILSGQDDDNCQFVVDFPSQIATCLGKITHIARHFRRSIDGSWQVVVVGIVTAIILVSVHVLWVCMFLLQKWPRVNVVFVVYKQHFSFKSTQFAYRTLSLSTWTDLILIADEPKAFCRLRISSFLNANKRQQVFCCVTKHGRR